MRKSALSAGTDYVRVFDYNTEPYKTWEWQGPFLERFKIVEGSLASLKRSLLYRRHLGPDWMYSKTLRLHRWKGEVSFRVTTRSYDFIRVIDTQSIEGMISEPDTL